MIKGGIDVSIINPWIIYLIAVLNHLSTAALIGVAIGLGMMIAIWCDNPENIKPFRFAKWLFAISITLMVLIPSKEEMYTMLVADTVTYEMVDTVGEGVKGTVDYIVDAVDQMLNGEKE